MKRKPLKRKAKRGPRTRSKYRDRPRDLDFMLQVKSLPCFALISGLSGCHGPIEADHTGARGMGRKADDGTCISLCQLHHRQRTDFSGPFRSWDQEKMRAWLELGRGFVALTLDIGTGHPDPGDPIF